MTLFLVVALAALFVVQVILAVFASANPEGGALGSVGAFATYALLSLGGFALIYFDHRVWALILVAFVCVADFYTISVDSARSGD